MSFLNISFSMGFPSPGLENSVPPQDIFQRHHISAIAPETRWSEAVPWQSSSKLVLGKVEDGSWGWVMFKLCGSKHTHWGRNSLDWTQCLMLSLAGAETDTKHLWDGLAVSQPLTPSMLHWHRLSWCCRWWCFKKAACVRSILQSPESWFILIPCWHVEK